MPTMDTKRPTTGDILILLGVVFMLSALLFEDPGSRFLTLVLGVGVIVAGVFANRARPCDQ